ncbi:uncharacterized protein LOC129601069 [Paramacrobiotus metropolitanus]|uniref:uncharacterized protein LOC129601069 n=1 Tax=Paramacrobiotus metropolitanus TaxID=2943436 RepID=UPI00244605D5|nr:uncharacterized protein LOC129601069 [Paramacrobiotus metropolitanus]
MLYSLSVVVVLAVGASCATTMPAWFFGAVPGSDPTTRLYYVNYPFPNKEPWYYPVKSLQSGFQLGSSASSDAYMDDGKLSTSNSAKTLLDSSGNKITQAQSGTVAQGLSGQMVNYVGAHAFRK